MIFNEENRKKYSSGSLLKKKSCNGRTIIVESLDVHTKERINKRVSEASKQYIAEYYKNLQAEETNFKSPGKVLVKRG